MKERVHRLWTNARIATLIPGGAPFGAIEGAGIAARDGRIVWIGPDAERPDLTADETFDLDGRWVTPGLVDCHTHLIFGGSRAAEWEMRLNGEPYEAIAKAGGGILSTVRATRAASEDALLRSALRRLDALIAEGVTTVEVKSGYGLDVETEARMLRVARRLGQQRPVTVRTTFLGAHALPPEAAGDRDAYIEAVCREQLSAIAAQGLADAVDAFCERIAFSAPQVARVFEAARAHGLPAKLHAEQLTNSGGAALAASYGALSADHLEHLDEAGARAMAAAGTVAVLLPGAFYVLRETKKPPVELLRSMRVPIAVATDCNPGTSPIASLRTAMHLACTLFGLTPEEALAGATREAARALGLRHETGTIEPGKSCDLAIWEVERPAEIAYWIGLNPLSQRVWRGK